MNLAISHFLENTIDLLDHQIQKQNLRVVKDKRHSIHAGGRNPSTLGFFKKNY